MGHLTQRQVDDAHRAERQSRHRYEIGSTELVERSHPYLLFPRRRRLEEIVEAIPCRGRARLTEHHPEAVLVVCRAPERLLVLSPRSRATFLRDLEAADLMLVFQDGVVRRPGAEPIWLRAGRRALERRFALESAAIPYSSIRSGDEQTGRHAPPIYVETSISTTIAATKAANSTFVLIRSCSARLRCTASCKLETRPRPEERTWLW